MRRCWLLPFPGIPGLTLALVVLPVTPASAKGLSSSQIKTLENNLSHSNKLTFSASYTSVEGSQKQTVTIAQAPPKSNFTISNGSFIDTGKASYFCSQDASSGNSGNSANSGNSGNSGSTTTTTKTGGEQCITEKGANPLVSVEDIFSPTAALAALSEARVSAIAARLSGIKVSFSSGNYAGQSATCYSVTVRGKGTGKYCITKQGVLAYASTSSTQYFELTKFSLHPSSSLFNLPAGAKTVTIPTIPASS